MVSAWAGRRGWSVWRWGGGAVAAAAVALVLVSLWGGPGVSARDEEAGRAREKLPSDLALVPGDAVGLISVRVADAWDTEVARETRRQMARELGQAARTFENTFGVTPAQVKRLTWVQMSAGPSRNEPWLFFLATTGSYNQGKVAAAVAGSNAREEKRKGHILYVGDNGRAVHLIDDQAFVVGRADQVRALLDRGPTRDAAAPLESAVHLAAARHLAVGGLNQEVVRKALSDTLPKEAEPYRPLLQARSATVTFDLGKEARAVLDLRFANEDDAREGAQALQAAVYLGRQSLAGGIKEIGQHKDTKRIVELLRQVEAGAKTAQVRQQGRDVRLALAVKVDQSSVGPTISEEVRRVRETARRTVSANNLKQLALAMMNYADTQNGTFPPHAVYSKDGKPLLSWRVLLLPYVEEGQLFREFHLDEAWDSPHNKKLLARMPRLYAAPDGRGVKEHKTFYQVFVGKGAAFEGKKGLRFPADFTDGTSNTIMIAEASKPVPWTKPEDLPYDPDRPLPKLGGLFEGGFQAALCDGSVRFITKTISEKTLRAAITRNGGEVLGPDW